MPYQSTALALRQGKVWKTRSARTALRSWTGHFKPAHSEACLDRTVEAQGWWGANPPYHTPVFVVTHHGRAALLMEGGTTFHFVNDGIESALQQAFAAAHGKDVRLGGGSTLVRQYLRAGLVDELHLVITNKLLGSGERLFEGTDNIAHDYECLETIGFETVTHVRLVKKKRT